MEAFVYLAVVFGAALYIDRRLAGRVAPVDRTAAALAVIGVATLPIAGWLLFLPTFALLGLSAILFAFVPTSSFYSALKTKRRRVEELKSAPDEVKRPNGVAHGLCPNCDELIPMASSECPKCRAEFGQSSSWKIEPI
jgi:hypothetical protein